jgi:methyl-accepting chemotaxis protein WspA
LRSIAETKTAINNRHKQHVNDAKQSAILFSLAMLSFGFFAWIITHTVSKRLRALSQVAKRAGSAKDLSILSNDASEDEIGVVALSFNELISTLRTILHNIKHSGSLVSNSSAEIAAVSRQQQATTAQIAATSTLQSKPPVEPLMGKRISKKMRATVHGITTAVEGISQKLAALNQQAASIGGVVVTIAKVADQTNLLSLNAAIEAEKAGEYGHGFAVVAREIRRLADQTGASTTDIEKMVREIQGGVSAGVMAMEKFAHEVQRGASEIEDSSGVFSEIIQQIHALTPTFVTVSEGMDLQAKSALQITESLGQLSSAARQTADSLAQSNQSIEQLHQATLLMQGEVDKFKVDGVQ